MRPSFIGLGRTSVYRMRQKTLLSNFRTYELDVSQVQSPLANQYSSYATLAWKSPRVELILPTLETNLSLHREES